MPRCVAFAVVLALVAIAGCGGSDAPLTVSAASSLKPAFTAYGGARFSFAGSDELAAQIQQGVKPDVFAAANTALPDALFAKGLVEKPVVFAANRLVLAVPRDSRIRGLGDLRARKLAVGAPSVPIGAYTRQVLAKLPAAEARRILAQVRSDEPDAAGIVGKLTQGAVDAGFVYATDVRAAGGALRAIALPASAQPQVAYGAAVVKGAKHAGEARAFIAGLMKGRGAAALRKAGFAPPPA